MTKLEIANFDHIVRETSSVGKHAHARGEGTINVGSEAQRIIDQVTSSCGFAVLLFARVHRCADAEQVAEAKKLAPKFGTLVSEPSQLRKEAEEKNEFLRKGSSTGDVGASFTSSSSSIVTHHKPAESTPLQIETAL
jgi:hypothetical protein